MRTQHRDRRGGEREVDDCGDRERDRDDARQLAGGVAEPGGHRRDRLPAHEREHQHCRGTADRRPPMRRERRPVAGVHAPPSRPPRLRSARREPRSGRAAPRCARAPARVSDIITASSPAAIAMVAARRPDQLRHVAGADQADERRAEDDSARKHQPTARPATAEPGRGVGRRRRRGCGSGCRAGEHDREQAGQAEQSDPGQQRRRAGQPGREAGQQEQPRAEQRADVEGGRARGGERSVMPQQCRKRPGTRCQILRWRAPLSAIILRAYCR